MHKNYFLDVIGKKSPLFASMLRFNGVMPTDGATFPCPPVGALTSVPKAYLNELWQHGPSRAHLREFVRPTVEPFWDFSEESRCLALLEPATLNELTLFYGATLHAHEIARTIMGKELAILHQTLGKHIHAYALQRGQYQVAAAQDEFASRNREIPLAERVAIHGKEALGIIVSGWPDALQNRVAIQPPADMHLSSTLQSGIWFTMKKILLREVAPAWAPCFA